MASIQLTDELLSGIQKLLQQNDEQAADAGIGVQYLAAIMGLMVARFPVDTQRRNAMLDQLFELARHVMDENTQQEPAAGPPGGEAFGIWKPE